MEIFRKRLMEGLVGSEDGAKEAPGPVWPYESINDLTDWEALIAEQDRLAEELVEDESGRMKWKDD